MIVTSKYAFYISQKIYVQDKEYKVIISTAQRTYERRTHCHYAPQTGNVLTV